jgi:hypothetical protein
MVMRVSTRSRRLLALLALLATVVTTASVGLASIECARYSLSPHRIGGYNPATTAGGVAIVADLAYLAVGTGGLQVLDLANPAAPQLVGSVALPGVGGALDVAVNGRYAFVAMGPTGIKVVDIANPSAPVVVGQVDTPGNANSVAVAGNLVFVADRTPGLQVIDVTDPMHPRIIGASVTMNSALDVAVAGSYAYIAADIAGLCAIDITDPQHPSIAGSVDTPYGAVGVAVAGTFAYVADRQGGLQIIDVSNPEAPAGVAAVTLPEALDVTVTQGKAWVADRSGLRVVDVTDPLKPSLVGDVRLPAGLTHVAVADDQALISEQTRGLHVIEIAGGRSPDLVGGVGTTFPAKAVAVQDHYSYVAVVGAVGLQVVDMLDAAHPALVGSAYTGQATHEVAAKGDLAFVTTEWYHEFGWYEYRLHLLDISYPAAPNYITDIEIPNMGPMCLVGSCLYIATGGIEVIDVADPAHPHLLDVGSLPGFDLAVMGKTGYAATAAGLQVLDLTDPASPQLAGSVATNGGCRWVEVQGNLAYLASPSRLEIVDVADPDVPLLLGDVTVSFPFVLAGLAVIGTHAYAPQSDYGVSVFDVADPRHPRLEGSIATHGQAVGVCPAGVGIAVADGDAGLTIIPLACEQPIGVGEDVQVTASSAFDLYPNPGPGPITCRFTLSRGGPVRLSIYDLAGRRVREVVREIADAGGHDLHWDGRDDAGRAAPAGVYLVRIATASGPRTARVAIVR